MADVLVRPNHTGWIVMRRVGPQQLIEAGTFQSRKEAVEFARYLKGEIDQGRG